CGDCSPGFSSLDRACLHPRRDDYPQHFAATDRGRRISIVRWNSDGGHRRATRCRRHADADVLSFHGLLDHRPATMGLALLPAELGCVWNMVWTESRADLNRDRSVTRMAAHGPFARNTRSECGARALLIPEVLCSLRTTLASSAKGSAS